MLSGSFTHSGLEEAIKATDNLKNFVGPAATVSLEVDPEQQAILGYQAKRGRDAATIRPEEKREVGEIIRDHVISALRARDFSGRRWMPMYQALGTWLKDLIADHIDDSRPVPKAELSPEYAKHKQERFGKVRPILVASGKLLAAFRNARVRIEGR